MFREIVSTLQQSAQKNISFAGKILTLGIYVLHSVNQHKTYVMIDASG